MPGAGSQPSLQVGASAQPVTVTAARPLRGGRKAERRAAGRRAGLAAAGTEAGRTSSTARGGAQLGIGAP